MKSLILLSVFFTLNLHSYSSNIQNAVAIGIFDKNGNGENIQHKRETKYGYDGICYSKIVVFGFLNQSKPKVIIGNSIGKQIHSIPVYNQYKEKIGEELTFKHYTIRSGQFKVYIDDKLYDSKVYVK